MAATAEVKDRVGWITLDRPPDNTYDPAFLEELDRCVGEVAEAEVAVAVIRSASERSSRPGPTSRPTWSGRSRRAWPRPAGPPGAGPLRGRGTAVRRRHRRPRPRRRLRDRAGLRHPHRRPGPLPDRPARGRLGAAARHRRHPAAAPAHRPRPGPRADRPTAGRPPRPRAERLGMVDRLVPAGEFARPGGGRPGGRAGRWRLAGRGRDTRVVNDAAASASLEYALERELEELASLLASEDAHEGMTAAVSRSGCPGSPGADTPLPPGARR